MMNQNHPYHLVNYSPWPILMSFGTFMIASSLIIWFHKFNNFLLLFSLIISIIILIQWWRDTIRESTFQGNHSFKVLKGLEWGMILFIISEIMFFLSFFWSFLHNSLSPSMELGLIWPPNSINVFNPLHIPLLNTLILLSSGLTVTWAHHSMIENNYNSMTQSLFLTILLGIYFTFLQLIEYIEASFTIADSIYGASFFMATGFHGLHVMIGTMFLSVCLIRHLTNQFSFNHHFGFEAAIWYWHFVDVVWLFLYLLVYWWSK
uniref:Cytochrome c oxidase subunit 3 n=1 Tax=Cucujoidea sp. 22 KM-2017 TaxID=2219359 RepID=A0A346RI88_9CUCU|nr:cytochrome c oxidase subunit 3 [Cucujoidea sp. 22 KM-2017]